MSGGPRLGKPCDYETRLWATTMRVGVFGGSFDPVHDGHLRVAQTCRTAVPLDRVLFVPAARQPLKPDGPVASPADRIRMLELALEHLLPGGERGQSPPFVVSDLETRRGGVSYTVDTLRQLSAARPDDRLHLILGGDTLADLSQWREPEAICELATLVVVDRPGAEAPSGPRSASVIHVSMDPICVSSSG